MSIDLEDLKRRMNTLTTGERNTETPFVVWDSVSQLLDWAISMEKSDYKRAWESSQFFLQERTNEVVRLKEQLKDALAARITLPVAYNYTTEYVNDLRRQTVTAKESRDTSVSAALDFAFGYYTAERKPTIEETKTATRAFVAAYNRENR